MDEITPRDSRGRILAPFPNSQPFTGASGRTAAQKRWAKYRAAAVERITKVIAEVDPEVSNGAMAFAVIAGEQARTLMNAKDAKIADVEKLGRIMTGMSEEVRRENGAGGPPAGVVQVAPAALLDLVRLIEQEKRAAVDQSQAADGVINA